MPIVSVLMTSFNRELYIEEAIQSVLASSFEDWELIICDDVSSDRTVEIARKYEKSDRRIKVYVNEKNLGDYPNRNRVASYATGKYLKYLDSDDIIYPWGLQAMVYGMEKFPEAGFGLASISYVTESKLPLLLSPYESYVEFFLKNNLISTAPTSSIIKRDIFERVGGFSGKPYVGDFEMWLNLAKTSSLVVLPPKLTWWRKHFNQQLFEGVNNNYYEDNSYGIYLDALQSTDCPLTHEQQITAIKTLKKSRARSVLRKLLKADIGRFLELYKKYGLSVSDMIRCLQK